MGYKQFEIDTIGFDGKTVPFTFNLENISYYRPYVNSPEEVGKKARLQTMVYMLGSVKAIYVNCSYESFTAKIKEIQDKKE